MRIEVQRIVGDTALTLEDGQNLYSLLQPALLKGEKILVDFTGISIFASLFFNAAIGQLLKDFRPESLNALLTIENLNASGRDTLVRSIANAKTYYASGEFRKVQRDVLRAMAETE